MRPLVVVCSVLFLGSVAAGIAAIESGRREKLEAIIDAKRKEGISGRAPIPAATRARPSEPRRPLAWRDVKPDARNHARAVPYERDFDRALSTDREHSTIVVEVRALMATPFGETLRTCARPGRTYSPIGQLERIAGQGALDKLERIAFSEHLGVLEGRFGELASLGGEWQPYGDRGAILIDGSAPLGRWSDHLVLLGREEAVRDAIDRLEGRAPYTVDLSAADRQGLVYGSLRAGSFVRETAPEFNLHDVLRDGEGLLPISIRVDAASDLEAQVTIPLPNREIIELALEKLGYAREKSAADPERLRIENIQSDEQEIRFSARLTLEQIRQAKEKCEQASDVDELD